MALVGIAFLGLFAWNAFRMLRMFKRGRATERTLTQAQFEHERNLALDLRAEMNRALNDLDQVS